MIEYVQGVAATPSLLGSGASASRATGTDFGDWLTQQLDALNRKIVAGDDQVRRLALGEAGNLHEVMMRLEEARLSFELTVQVRNRVLEAYQEVMRMQI